MYTMFITKMVFYSCEKCGKQFSLNHDYKN